MTSATSAKKRFLLLHVGFTPPTPEIMKAWGAWMDSLKPIQVDMGGFMGGTEIAGSGERVLPWDASQRSHRLQHHRGREHGGGARRGPAGALDHGDQGLRAAAALIGR